MFGFEVNTNQVNVGRKNIEAMLTENPEVKKVLQTLISEQILYARGRLAKDLKDKMPGSVHESWRAVRRVVYRKVLGGNLNILNMKKGTAKYRHIDRVRKVEQNPHMRGGNRRKRSNRTKLIDNYAGSSRGFILRFVEDGTNQRFIGGRNRFKTNIEYLNRIEMGTGNRGRITPRFMFDKFANVELREAARVIGEMIDQELDKVFNKNNTQ